MIAVDEHLVAGRCVGEHVLALADHRDAQRPRRVGDLPQRRIGHAPEPTGPLQAPDAAACALQQKDVVGILVRTDPAAAGSKITLASTIGFHSRSRPQLIFPMRTASGSSNSTQPRPASSPIQLWPLPYLPSLMCSSL